MRRMTPPSSLLKCQKLPGDVCLKDPSNGQIPRRAFHGGHIAPPPHQRTQVRGRFVFLTDIRAHVEPQWKLLEVVFMATPCASIAPDGSVAKWYDNFKGPGPPTEGIQTLHVAVDAKAWG